MKCTNNDHYRVDLNALIAVFVGFAAAFIKQE
jgi:hypothetical protein